MHHPFGSVPSIRRLFGLTEGQANILIPVMELRWGVSCHGQEILTLCKAKLTLHKEVPIVLYSEVPNMIECKNGCSEVKNMTTRKSYSEIGNWIANVIRLIRGQRT